MTKPGVTYEKLTEAASEAFKLIEQKRLGADVGKQLRAVEARIFERGEQNDR